MTKKLLFTVEGPGEYYTIYFYDNGTYKYSDMENIFLWTVEDGIIKSKENVSFKKTYMMSAATQEAYQKYYIRKLIEE